MTFLLWGYFGFDPIGAMLVRIGVSVSLMALAATRRSEALAAAAGALMANVLGGWAMVFALATKAGGGDGAISLPAAWAFAGGVFGLGVVLGERIYRVLSLGLLGFATGHVLMIDVWELGSLARVASFGAVGAVLVVLGFFYNRFGERLRRARCGQKRACWSGGFVGVSPPSHPGAVGF